MSGCATHDEGPDWLLEVADDRPGIPASARADVFKMFHTLQSVSGSRGVGLAAVRKLVLVYGGRIEAQANSPRGVVFRITWPKP